jgi:hypothetical protein
MRQGRVLGGDRVSQITTDRDGHFTFDDTGFDRTVLVTHERGFLQTTTRDIRTNQTIKLNPWGRVEGTLREGRKEVGGAGVGLFALNRSSLGDWVINLEAKTDAAGIFVFDKVPSGDFLLCRRFVSEGQEISSHQVAVFVKGGELVKMDLGGSGIPIVGRMTDDVDWLKSDQFLALKVPVMKIVEMDDFLNRKDFETANIPELSRRDRAGRTYRLIFERNGSFRIEDVPAGKYDLNIVLKEQGTSHDPFEPRKEIASFRKEIIVPEMPRGRSDEPLNLGQLSLFWLQK